ncbi:hypothetical protein JCM10908_007013 [Rhodotorula pacifica]|uniref:uncharacterized protein n=1 Tax=Rhodotorula pacifica TaxID=1495444 RepID=UPI00316DB2BE
MSVTLSPSGQLGFQRPLTQLVKRTLSVTNSSNAHAVAYKVKTTAPKQYCVRPNSGRIEPGETVEVHVLLQPMKEDPAPGAKCRDKFLVQSVIITPERESTPLPDLWKQLEDAERTRTDGGVSEIHEQKIRCAYLPAADSDVAHTPIPEEAHAADGDASRLTTGGDASFVSSSGTSRTTSSPTPFAASIAGTSTPPSTDSNDASVPTQAREAASGAAAAVGLTGVAAKLSPEHASHGMALGAPVGGSATNTTATSSASRSTPIVASAPTAATATDSSSSSSTELSRLRTELDAARAEISRLKSQLDAVETTNATLRSRGAGAGGSTISSGTGAGITSQAVVDLKGQEGVPVQVVAGIAFGVFVVTWLFF